MNRHDLRRIASISGISAASLVAAIAQAEGAPPRELIYPERPNLILPDNALTREERGLLQKLAIIPGLGFVPAFGGGGTPMLMNAVTFDGTNDYMLRGGGLTGAVDSSTFIFSCWINRSAVGTTQFLMGFGGATSFLNFNGSNELFYFLLDGTGAKAISGNSASAFSSTGSWYHLALSVNTATTTASLAVNGSSISISATNDGGSFSGDFTRTDYSIGALTNSNAKLFADVAQYYFAIGTYMDFTNSTNIEKFRTSAGKPADLGVDGSAPTGSQPIIYLNGDASTFHINKGYGGNFSVVGSLVDAVGPY